MHRIDELILKYVKELEYDEAYEMFLRVNSGKKLRSKLILKIANQSDEVLKLCAVIEMIHLASLLHDDVIDDADTRRGQPSINSIFGSKNAIMLGDILYSKGFLKLCEFDKEIAQIVSNAVSKLSVGEMLDVSLSHNFSADKDKYMSMIYSKTAVLIEASAECAAILSNQDRTKFKTYGKNLGLAFQIIDDVLDITQNSQTLGKPAMNDYVEGKVTLPYIYLYESLNQSDKQELRSLYKKRLDETQSKWLMDKLICTNALKNSINEARRLGLEALDAIKEYKNFELEKIIQDMIDREF